MIWILPSTPPPSPKSFVPSPASRASHFLIKSFSSPKKWKQKKCFQWIGKPAGTFLSNLFTTLAKCRDSFSRNWILKVWASSLNWNESRQAESVSYRRELWTRHIQDFRQMRVRKRALLAPHGSERWDLHAFVHHQDRHGHVGRLNEFPGSLQNRKSVVVRRERSWWKLQCKMLRTGRWRHRRRRRLRKQDFGLARAWWMDANRITVQK